MMDIIIIPAYEPDEAIISVVSELSERDNMIIIVDDGSGTACEKIFEKCGKDAVILTHDVNKGKGAAIKTALKYIKDNICAEYVVGIMDADGQHRVCDMYRVMNEAKVKSGSLVIGVREIDDKMPVKSRIGNALTRWVFAKVSGVSVSDTQTGLRAYDSSLVDMMLRVTGSRYEYETNVLLECVRDSIEIEEAKIATIYHDKNNSCTHFNPIKDSFRIYKDLLRFTLSSMTSFVVDYILFCIFMVLMSKTSYGIIIANVLARIISGMYNYYINCVYVFKTKKDLKSGVQYFWLALLILLFNNILISLYHDTLGIDAYVAKIVTEISLFIISFTVQKLFIYKKTIKKA